MMRPGPRRDLLVLAVLFVVSLPLVTTRIYASDEVQYFSYLRSLWFDHDVSFENEYRYFHEHGFNYPLFRETFLERRNDDTGLRVSFATLGSALLWSPFYGAADVTVRIRRALGSDVAADGLSPPYIAAVAYGSAFYGWLSVVLAWWMARRVIGDALALPAALAIWLGTPLLFYMYIAPPMSHACSAFAVAAFLATWLKVRERWTPAGCAALGALAALMAMVREQDAFIAIGPMLDWALTALVGSRVTAPSPRLPARRSRGEVGRGEGWGEGFSQLRRLVLQIAAAGAAFSLVFLPQLLAYNALNGYPGPSRLVGRKMTWTTPHALEVLGSPEHGLLVWTPLVALSLAGLLWMALGTGSAGAQEPRSAETAPSGKEGGASAPPDMRRIALCLLLSVASQVYVAGSVESWTVAGAFGQRRFLGLSIIFCLGLAAIWSRARTRSVHVAAAAVVMLAVWWNLGLTAQFGLGLMDRQRLEPARNAYHTFVTIPMRLPELAYRYVFARSSFYKPPARSEP